MIRDFEKSITTRIEEIVNKENRKRLKEMDGECKANKMSPHTRLNKIQALRKLDAFLEKPFENATREDLSAFFGELNEKHKPSTSRVLMAHVKSFYKWLEGNGDIYPEKVRWLKVSGGRGRATVSHEDILTHEEIYDLVKACNHPRDRAMVMVLWESAARAGEFLRMKVGSIHSDEYGKFVTLKGKTGLREVRLIKSQTYVETWLNHHPDPENKKAPLWPAFANNQHRKGLRGINASRLSDTIKTAQKRSGIQKEVHPHLLRHTRLTELAVKYTEPVLRRIAGWTPTSAMPSVYVHLSGRDVKDEMAVKEGLKPKEEKEEESPLDGWDCVFCKAENPVTSIWCGNCGRFKDTELEKIERAKVEIGEKFNAILDDPEVRELLERKMQAMMS